jgi:hypothetical protein
MSETLTGSSSPENISPAIRAVRLSEEFILFPQGQIVPNDQDEIEAESQIVLGLGTKQLAMDISLSYVPPIQGAEMTLNFALIVNPSTSALSNEKLITPVRRKLTSTFRHTLKDMSLILEIPDITGRAETIKITTRPQLEDPITRNIIEADGTTQKSITEAFGIGDDFAYQVVNDEALLILKNLTSLKGTFTGTPYEEDE